MNWNHPNAQDYRVYRRQDAFYLLRETFSLQLAGPFQASEILRAYRLSDSFEDNSWYTHVWSPQYWFDDRNGAEVGEGELARDYTPVDIGCLPLSVTRYHWGDDQLLCARHSLAWCERKAPEVGSLPAVLSEQQGLLISADKSVSGYLLRDWNNHPVGSLLLSKGSISGLEAWVIDFPIGFPDRVTEE